MKKSQPIKLKNVAVHNLRGIDLQLEKNQLIVFTGVSGSGKSSMAFDTIYAEGQRRYVESLPSHARRHLGDLPKPELDHAEGLSPTISIEQKTIGRNPRSTVGTMTEIYDYMRVLFARVATPHCPVSGEIVAPRSADAIIREVQSLSPGTELTILAPIVQGKKGSLKDELELLLRKGFMRVRIDGETSRLDEEITLDESKTHKLEAVVDRLKVSASNASRIAESLSMALELGQGLCTIVSDKREKLLSMQSYAHKSGLSYESLNPQDFSFNSPQGMCPSCEGLGVVSDFDLSLVIDEEKSIAEDCCSVASSSSTSFYGNIYRNIARLYQFKLTTPWKKLPEEAKSVFLYGTEQKWTRMTFVNPKTRKRSVEYIEWKGVLHEARRRLGQAKSERYREKMAKLMTKLPCPICKGARIQPYARAARLGGAGIADLTAMTIGALRTFFETLTLSRSDLEIAKELCLALRGRLEFLSLVGLDYLTLDRTAPTLSGGEAQRVRLASQIGCGLVGVTYVLDEPSIGLHMRDNERLIETLKALRDRGNTVIVVEHDEETIWSADHVVDFGPGAGVEGGRIVAEGTLKDLLQARESVTGAYLAGRRHIALPGQRRKPGKERLLIHKAAHHNLKSVNVEIPLGLLVGVTGVSGSGKSSLISGILHPALANQLHGAEHLVGSYEGLEGYDQIEKVITIDQSPIGRNVRSNPATYIKVFDHIRDLFSQLPESKARGYPVGRFSFNVQEGSCANCSGLGVLRIDMDFLEDAFITCPLCQGKRFDMETLEVRYKEKNIHDVLEMSVHEARGFFDAVPAIRGKLETLERVGLGYIKLGQSSTTLSGGEAQRTKLARELARPATGKTLYILDEPTTGLHFEDIRHLLNVLIALIDQGNSVLVIEHNMDVIKSCDWIIDLGPEGGEGGGQILATGTPEQIGQLDTPTGHALMRTLNPEDRAARLDKRETAAAKPITEITVTGANQNNLKGVDVSIPRGKITVCTGPSGSGKSSLAFETIYAEGQRRYIDSLSPYARQFVKQMPKPRVTSVEGLSPAIAIEQKAIAGNPRSTVGTQTEIYDYLRLLYARAGTAHCPETGEVIRSISKEHVALQLLRHPTDTALHILAPLQEELEVAVKRYHRQGFMRIRVNGKIYELDEEIPVKEGRRVSLQLVVDRLRVRPSNRTRLLEAIETASAIGKSKVIGLSEEGGEELFNLSFAVQSTGKSYPPITPHSFSFNHRMGMCPDCLGLGRQAGISKQQMSAYRSIEDLIVSLWPPKSEKALTLALRCLEAAGVDASRPASDLTSHELQLLLKGSRETMCQIDGHPVRWRGLNATLGRLGHGARNAVRQHVAASLEEMECVSCQGMRLHPLARAVTLVGVRLGELCHWPITQALKFIKDLKLKGDSARLLADVHKSLISRLQFLCSVGLGYLSLDRSAPTLSNGEAQRIHLARQLGAGLTGVLYVLDEPTVGLHPHDNAMLSQALQALRSLGNTILMVEHDPLTVKQADYVLDFGPKAGRHGGYIVAKGTVGQLGRKASSPTGRYLCGRRVITRTRLKAEPNEPQLTLDVGQVRNLKGSHISLPMRKLCCITGVSGSGKSTLLHEVIEKSVERMLYKRKAPFSNMIILDQDPIGQTNRSDVGTYTEILSALRDVYAQLPLAKARALRPGHFSTNHKSGMCMRCWGLGYRKVSLHFLPPVRVSCDQCHGLRLNSRSLEVSYAGVNFGRALDTTIEEAAELFGNIPKIRRRLKPLLDTGLGYLKLGQEVASLSGGEAQRLRLSRELSKRSSGDTLYLLDEPTTGLHYSDVELLLQVLHALIVKGNTLIVIEHNLDIIKNADHVVDMGPGPGAAGGEVVASGTPEKIAACSASRTGEYLLEELKPCAY